jgi:hypothetical protein
VKPRDLIVWIGASLAFVVGLGLLVGWLAARDDHGGLDWELAGIIGTALGTTALAGFTGALAAFTSGEVSATRELVQVQREEQEERDLPNLVLHAAPWDGSPGDITIHVHLINAGRGAAFGIEMSVEHNDPAYPVEVVGGGRWSAIAPGGDARFAVKARFPQAPPGGNVRGFTVAGVYRDRWLAREYTILTAFRTA